MYIFLKEQSDWRLKILVMLKNKNYWLSCASEWQSQVRMCQEQ